MGISENQTVIIALFFVIVLIVPFTVIHEIGHSLVCLADGHEFHIYIEIFTSSSMICKGKISHLTLFNAAGGVLAAVVAIVVILLLRCGFITIAMGSIAISHAMNAIIEAGFHESYMSADFWPAIFLFTDSAIFIGISFLYLRRQPNPPLKI